MDAKKGASVLIPNMGGGLLGKAEKKAEIHIAPPTFAETTENNTSTADSKNLRLNNKNQSIII